MPVSLRHLSSTSATPNLRPQAEFCRRGLAEVSITAAEVNQWADELIVDAAKTEDWMLELSTSDEAALAP